MDLQALSQMLSSGFQPQVEVHAVDPSIYLIYCKIGEQLKPLLRRDGSILKYRSRSAATRDLREAGLKTVEFVHRSAFEEMIGVAESAQPTEHRERIKLTTTS